MERGQPVFAATVRPTSRGILARAVWTQRLSTPLMPMDLDRLREAGQAGIQVQYIGTNAV